MSAVRAEQELLAGLAARIERARYLRPAERAVVEISRIVAGERDSLGNGLVDDGVAHLREPINVRLARAEVAALDRVTEEALDAVPIIWIVLGSIDAALGSDAVAPAGRVLKAEGINMIAELAQGRGCGRARQTGTDHDDPVLPLVRGGDQLQFLLAFVPLLMQGAGWYFAVEDHRNCTPRIGHGA